MVTRQRILWEYRQQANLWAPLPGELFVKETRSGEVKLPPRVFDVCHNLFVTSPAGNRRLGNLALANGDVDDCFDPLELTPEALIKLGYVTSLSLPGRPVAH